MTGRRAWLFPGQGSQRKGMGAALFGRFPVELEQADKILGFSVASTCLDDTEDRLRHTRFLQPALFVVNTLSYLDHARENQPPDMVAGHSLGEYTALFAAGAFDFPTGVRLVRRRGELMGEAAGGGVLAVVGPQAHQSPGVLRDTGITEIDVANHNAPDQLVLAGPAEAIRQAADVLRSAGVGRCVPLQVSAAFHSRYMAEPAARFAEFLTSVALDDPVMPVLSNVTALPYEPDQVRQLLAQQIRSPVRWSEITSYLLAHGVHEVTELGPGRVLTRLWEASVQARTSATVEPGRPADHLTGGSAEPIHLVPEALGSAAFRGHYGVRYAYLAGSMYHGIASTDLVIRMGKAGLMGFFGAGGLRLERVDEALALLSRELGGVHRHGVNLLHAPDRPDLEDATVRLFLRHDVRYVEAAGYTQLTPALVQYRLHGAHRDRDGIPVAIRRVVAKVSRPEVAAAFMRPAPQAMVARLVADGRITAAEAELAPQLPVSGDICVEADSGGHTDGGAACVLIPAITRLRDEIMRERRYPTPLRVGTAGGLGSPESVAAAFLLGAEFVVTGSVNQCSPEAATSADVKDLLAQARVQDTAYAPAGDMFELGARVQVLRRGTLFPARANKLYQIYRQHAGLHEIDPQVLRTIETTYFHRSVEQVWAETREHYIHSGRREENERVERNPKLKMAAVFRWYFAHTTRLALDGATQDRVNYQVHTGPAIGAFNEFVRGTELSDWRHRHVDVIAEALMGGAARLIASWLSRIAADTLEPCSILGGRKALDRAG